MPTPLHPTAKRFGRHGSALPAHRLPDPSGRFPGGTFRPRLRTLRRVPGAGRALPTVPMPSRGLFVVFVFFLLIGCARQLPPPPPPTPSLPADTRYPGEGDARDVEEEEPPRKRTVVPAPSVSPLVGGRDDAILTSPWVRDEGIEERIDWWLNYWRTRGQGSFQRSLVRMGRYEDFVVDELLARGLPLSLRHLPIIEASYYPIALSPAGAGGLWQFMPATARWLGLRVNAVVDQRFDPYAATPLAVDYLSRLHTQFGSWFLALAAYNGGPGRLERIIQEHGDGRPRDDALFLRIQDELPAETRDFIPKYLAAVRAANDPSAIGLTGYVKDPPQAFDVVTVQGAATLDVVAEVAGTTEEEVRGLNPQLLRGLTPAGESTRIRLPAGLGRTFPARFAAVPPEERVTFTEHRVVAGETLSHIARIYGVSVAGLLGANPGIAPRRLGIGTVLVIPRSDGPSARRDRDADVVGSGPPSALEANDVFHLFARGESLWMIASWYNIGVDRLLRYNELSEDAQVQPGDTLRIPPLGRQEE